MSESDFNEAVEAYRRALNAICKGDPQPVLELFSRRNDVTLANPLGPPRRGRTEVETATKDAATHFRGGNSSFEEVSRYTTPDLGYVLHLERAEVKLGAGDEMARISLRVTTIFRREEGIWRVAHRHADPIITPRDVTSIVERSG
ncbi:MAG TPA: SgcJ/EcaC family oxidoreductase [Chloroflexota bacterium]|nr:SgcJ/EcaC family oxidoreductase [Chloroflexota bacterium]